MAVKEDEGWGVMETSSHLGFPCHWIKFFFLQSIVLFLMYNTIPTLLYVFSFPMLSTPKIPRDFIGPLLEKYIIQLL